MSTEESKLPEIFGQLLKTIPFLSKHDFYIIYNLFIFNVCYIEV